MRTRTSSQHRLRWALGATAVALALVGCAVGLMRPRLDQPTVVTAPAPSAAAVPEAVVVSTVGGPRLPHEKHLGLGLECVDCHEIGDEGPGYPEAEFCLECHEEMQEDEETPAEQRVENVFFTPEGGPAWQKAIRDYDPAIVFDHAKHGAVECVECHANLDDLPRRAELLYTMNDCTACHEKRGASLTCAVCHPSIREDVAPPSHVATWATSHGRVWRDNQARGEEGTCAYCHAVPSYCNECHFNELPASHALDWEVQHGLQVRDAQLRGQTPSCAVCHRDPAYCNDCHWNVLPTSHEGEWETTHGRRVLEAGGPGEASCTYCHREQAFCDDCHMNVMPSSHKHLWIRRHGALARVQGVSCGAQCAFCHHETAFCEDCHRDMEPRDHTTLFRTRTHGVAASIDRARCSVCHETDFCVRCHEETAPRSHRGPWARGRNVHCMQCHFPIGSNPSCRVCHRTNPTHDTAPSMPAWHTPALNCRICHNAAGGGGAPPLRHVDNGLPCQLCHQ